MVMSYMAGIMGRPQTVISPWMTYDGSLDGGETLVAAAAYKVASVLHSTNQAVIAYTTGSERYVHVTTVNISDVTPTVNTANEAVTAQLSDISNDVRLMRISDTVGLVFCSSNSNGGKVYAYKYTISGNTVTLGGQQNLDISETTNVSPYHIGVSAFDSTYGLITLDNGNGNNYTVRAKCFNYSNPDAISLGAKLLIGADTALGKVNAYGAQTFNSTTALLIYGNGSGAIESYAVLTRIGTTLSINSSDNANHTYMGMYGTALSPDRVMGISWAYINVFNNAGLVITHGDCLACNPGASTDIHSACTIDAATGLVFFRDTVSPYKGKVVAASVSGVTPTATAATIVTAAALQDDTGVGSNTRRTACSAIDTTRALIAHIRTDNKAYVKIIKAGTGVPQAQSIQFSGSTQGLTLTNSWTGAADSSTGIMSLWGRFASVGSSEQIFLAASAGDATGYSMLKWNSGKFYYEMKNNAGTSRFYVGNNTQLEINKWYHLLMSWNTNAANGARTLHVYVNDASDPLIVSDTGNAFNQVLTTASGIANWYTARVSGAYYEQKLAELYFAPGQFLDFSVTANRRKFITADLKPVDLGGSGERPTGTAPLVYCHLRPGSIAGDFMRNCGTGGDWTSCAGSPTVLTGTIVGGT